MEKQQFLDYIVKNSTVSSVNGIWNKIKKDNPLNIRLKEVKDYISSLEISQTHKKNKIVNSFVAYKPRQEYQIDLTWIKKMNYEGEGMVINQLKDKKQYIYALTCIDVFSKFADLVIMKKKDENSVVEGMKRIIKKMGKPESIYTDDGSEFRSNFFQKFCEDNKIELIFSVGHAPFIERWHRTLKERLELYRLKSKSNTLTPDVLFGKNGIITEYNNSPVSTTKTSPVDAKKVEHQEEVHKNILDKATFKRRPILRVGDNVRVLLKTKNVEKKFIAKWSKEVYKIDDKIDKYFIINATERKKWLRYALQKVEGEVKTITVEPNNEGTKAKFLSDYTKQVTSEESKIEAKNFKEQADEDIKEKYNSRAKRVKIKNKKYDN